MKMSIFLEKTFTHFPDFTAFSKHWQNFNWTLLNHYIEIGGKNFKNAHMSLCTLIILGRKIVPFSQQTHNWISNSYFCIKNRKNPRFFFNLEFSIYIYRWACLSKHVWSNKLHCSHRILKILNQTCLVKQLWICLTKQSWPCSHRHWYCLSKHVWPNLFIKQVCNIIVSTPTKLVWSNMFDPKCLVILFVCEHGIRKFASTWPPENTKI